MFLGLIVLACNSKQIQQAKPYENYSGNVFDSSVAIKIAIANWIPLFGKRVFKKEPFEVIDRDSIWIVSGTLKKGVVGGVPFIKIRKLDGKILENYHTK